MQLKKVHQTYVCCGQLMTTETELKPKEEKALLCPRCNRRPVKTQMPYILLIK